MIRGTLSFSHALIAAVLLLTGCKDDQAMGKADPTTLDREAVGHYCGMIVADHPGPKGQIFVEGRIDPYWFTSVRDTIAFTLLPEEPKRITGIYVNDTARIGDWEAPEMSSWIGAETAWYVIGSSRRGGMGAAETVPFKEKQQAAAFAEDFGGHVVAFSEIPTDYVLGDAGTEADQAHAHGMDMKNDGEPTMKHRH
ncbi:MAG: nitrous oxide reductase accessory protein NosL [Rhodospirillales bacterium]|nr:nitrous oxide reductase accessory protein NosL [Rhodospirillales bacterium]